MNATKNISRIVFFLLATLLIIYINSRADEKAESIVEFKLKMIEKIRTDSLDSKDKMHEIIDGTSRFIEKSSQVKRGIRGLMLLFGLFALAEVAFVMVEKRNRQ